MHSNTIRSINSDNKCEFRVDAKAGAILKKRVCYTVRKMRHYDGSVNIHGSTNIFKQYYYWGDTQKALKKVQARLFKGIARGDARRNRKIVREEQKAAQSTPSITIVARELNPDAPER